MNISEPHLQYYLICELKKKHGPLSLLFNDTQQSYVQELDNLISKQKSLGKQIANTLESDDVLFFKEKPNKKNTPTLKKYNNEKVSMEKGQNSHYNIKCYRYGKI